MAHLINLGEWRKLIFVFYKRNSDINIDILLVKKIKIDVPCFPKYHKNKQMNGKKLCYVIFSKNMISIHLLPNAVLIFERET